MKKNCLLICMLILSLSSFAEDKIGSYSMSYFSGKTCDIKATEPKNGKFDIYITIGGKHKTDEVVIGVSSKELESFKRSLIEVRDKFIEWKETAVKNNVTDITKEFPAVFPRVTIAWYGSKWWFAFNQRINPTFFVFKDGKCAMVVYAKVKASTNEYIDQEIYWVLQEESEFNDIINLLDEKVVNEHFSAQETKADLFK